jgi:uncharacterized membrane protein YphA (DoxX/SURF4 family)
MNLNIHQIDKTLIVNTHKRSKIFFSSFGIALGIMFTITGIAKLFILPSFAETVSQLLPVTGTTAILIALIIIAIETVCGIGLLINKYLRPAAIFLGMLTTTFLYIHAFAIVEHRTFICQCFGIIPFSLSNSSELILNFIFLDLLILTYSLALPIQERASIGKKLAIAIAVILLLYGEVSVSKFILDRDLRDKPVNIYRINNFLFSQDHNLNGITQYRQIALIRIADFNCPPCFNDFVGFIKMTQQNFVPSRHAQSIIGLVEQSGAFSEPLAVNAWGKANNIIFPLIPVPDSIFQQFNFTKSCIIHQQPYGTLHSIYIFPGSESGRRELMSAFNE